MATVYSNTRHPKFVKWSCGVAVVIGIAAVVLYIVLDSDYGVFLYLAAMALLYFVVFYGDYLLGKYIVDEQAGTITDFRRKSYPIKVAELATIKYKVSRRGKFRSLFLHDTGVRFMDIRTSKENADLIVEQLTKMNPAIEVSNRNYIY